MERTNFRGAKQLWRRFFRILGLWTLLGLFFAMKHFFETHAYGHGVSWTKALWWHLMEWYGWAACSPLIFYACRRGDKWRHRWWAVAMIHLVAGTTATLLQIGICSIGAVIEATVLHTGFTWGQLYELLFITHFHFNLFIYAAIVSLWYAQQYYRRLGERELKSAGLEMLLSKPNCNL